MPEAENFSRRPRRQRTEPYHHGDLKRALVDAALTLIAEKGVTGFSLAEAARRAGMSPAAPYRHFPDKAHLVAAVAEQGFVELHRVLQDTATAFPDPRDALVQTGRRYVQWAVAHPDQYRVMFGAGLDGAALAGLRESGARSFDGLLGAITVSPAAQVIGSQDAHRLAGPLWALVHGVATLSIDGDLGHVGVDETPEDLAVRSIMLFLQGLV